MVDVTLEARGLRLTSAGDSQYFNYYWLRDNCSSSFDPQTRERVFDICALAQAPQAKAAWIEGGQLLIDWRDEAHRSAFSLEWLRERAAGRPRNDPAALPRQLWYGEHYTEFPRFEQSRLEADQIQRTAFARALLEQGIALVSDMRDDDHALGELAGLLGSVRASVCGNFFEVHVHPDPVNLSFTAAALELHTDTPAEELAPGIQFLHCRANSVQGGDSLFLDGVAVASDFRERHPRDFELLASRRIPFFYEHDDFDWRARQRVIELDERGEISGVTVSQHMADVFDLPQRELDDYYPAFVRFLQMMNRPEYLTRFRLNAGECIVFDNHRVVHGRDSYAAGSGERHLRGCYVDRGELRSTYRTLVKRADQPNSAISAA